MLINASQFAGHFFYKYYYFRVHLKIPFVDNLSKFVLQKNLNLKFK